MELRELSTFIQVAHFQSFSKAADKLGYSQAAVTIQIKQLESELGVRLFDRIGKKNSLTFEGELLYQYAGTILHEVSEVKERLAEKKILDGRLRIGTIESICSSILPHLLSEYHSLYPAVSISIVTDSPEHLLEMMSQNLVDIVYLLDKRMYDNNWIKVMEQPDDVVFVASPTHPLCQKDEVTMDDLLKEPFILTEKDASYRFILEQYLASQQKEIHPYLSIGNTEFIVRMIAKGIGMSFLPLFAVQPYIDRGQLAVIKPANFYLRVWRQIMYHKDKWYTGEMKAFVELGNAYL